MAAPRPSTAQQWVLASGNMAPVVGGYGMRSVIQSMATGEVSYGHRTDVVHACRKRGWLSEDGRTTDAGRRALEAAEAR